MALTRINDKDQFYWCRKLIQTIITYENAHTVDDVLNGKSGQRYFKVSRQLLGDAVLRELIEHELKGVNNELKGVNNEQ